MDVTRRREGSGSVSDADFANFLNIARRSVFEVANMLMIFTRENYLLSTESEPLLPELPEQSRMILAFHKTIKAQKSLEAASHERKLKTLPAPRSQLHAI